MNSLTRVQNYWDARSGDFSNSILAELNSSQGDWWLSLFQSELGTQPAQVLDCGCGPGFFSLLLNRCGHQVTATDYSPKMLQQAKSNLEQAGYAAKLLQMDAQQLDFPDESFDAIVSRNLLWNLDDPQAAYQEFFRVLKPGGKLIVADGNYYLHFHDAVYKEKRHENDLLMKKNGQDDPSGHRIFNKKQVDFTIMDDIAKAQPLSRHRRPQWDCQQLLELGVSSINVRLNTPGNHRANVSAYDNRYPLTFLIIAQK